MGTIFKRKIYDEMLVWKSESAGESALLIEGPRRVGKSTIVRTFAQNEYRSHIIIDFAKASTEEKRLFNDISDLDYFFIRLKLLKGVTLYERESVIIFDEVQQYPIARQAIKYLVEDGRYDYIETGSLISIHKNVDNIVIPSEEEAISMYPMDYEEFRWALGDTETIPLLKEMLGKKKSLGDDVNRKLLRDYRLYMLVGGMPQAVSKYIETMDLMKVDKVKRSILRIYEQDFHKLDNTDRAKAIFKAIPSELNMDSTRYRINTVLGKVRNDAVRGIVEMIEDSKTVNIAYHSNDPNVGMELTSDKSSYKMYLCDTGLFVTLAFWDKKYTDNVIYQKLLNDKLDANLGYVYENAVAQALVSSGNKLFYYTWLDDNKHTYEIDFLLSRGSKLWPLEVKSAGYSTHKSLDLFCKKFSSRINNRYLVYTKDLRKDCEVTMIPIYMVGLL
ncbi:MAG: AAA family ATPase [Candidatus Limisoma sp.]|nr:AAA family ATPase [Bacteroidales bacterium]MDY4942996.1 AAA family ATPase [Candidatus Limisoma sp.]